MRPLTLLCLPVTLFACGPDNTFTHADVHQNYAAHIELSPTELDFGALNTGWQRALPFAVTNVGDATLYVDPMVIEGSGAFTLTGAEEELMLAPGEQAEIMVTYTAARQEDAGEVRVLSTDPDHPELSVDLSGAGVFPSLSLTPDPYALGEHLTVCGPFQGELTLSNAGEGSATVREIGVTGGAFVVAETPELPFSLASGEETTITVESLVEEDGDWAGTVYVVSDDPAGPAEAEISATTSTWAMDDYFVQGAWAQTDVLLTVDRSCSMDDDAERLSAELPSLLLALEETGTDYQIAVVTQDNGCYNEALFTSDTEDAESKFKRAVFGVSGSWTEAGFTLAYNALGKVEEGECNEGFLRDGALMSIVNVSDEPEQSGATWSTMVGRIQEMTPTAVISAVAGPVPSGCATAMPGDGYAEAAEATGGFFADFCDVDWSEVAEDLAALSLGTDTTDTFVLSETPWEDTLEVTLDGDPAEGWRYDAASNAVIFDEEPEMGARIYVSYLYGMCDL